MRYLNQDTQNFIQGKYNGENVFDVVEEDAEYLKWLLDECPVNAEDRAVINQALGNPPEET
jgi:hypothetical protein